MSDWRRAALNVAERKAAVVLQRLATFETEGKRVFVSSSFQTQSLPLLHIMSRHGGRIPIVFLDTGYHFPETLSFRDAIAKRLGLEVINLRPSVPKSEQRTADGRLLFAADPDKCCFLNKVQPLEPCLHMYDVWVSGVRADQSGVRSGFSMEQPGPHGTLRYHPMLDWSGQEVYVYRQAYALPEHPLEQEGYLSVGCVPCTRPYTATLDDRGGRWSGQSKTECGLHTDLGTERER